MQSQRGAYRLVKGRKDGANTKPLTWYLEACGRDLCSASVSSSEPLPTHQLLPGHGGHCAVPSPQGDHQGEGIDNYTPSDSMKEGDTGVHAQDSRSSPYLILEFLQLPQMSRCLPGGTLGTHSPFSSDRAAYRS